MEMLFIRRVGVLGISSLNYTSALNNNKKNLYSDFLCVSFFSFLLSMLRNRMREKWPGIIINVSVRVTAQTYV